jgi:hypothetical protein
MATKKFKSNVSIQEKLILSGETAQRAPVINANGEIVSSTVTETELGHLTGVTSGVQGQLTAAQGDATQALADASAADAKAQGIIDAKGVANGYASLDANGTVPANQLPSYVDDVLEFDDLASFPGTGETGKIYVAIDTGKTYRWGGSVYAEISPSDVNSVNGATGVVVLDSGDLNHTQSTPANWTVADSSTIAAHLDELASRTQSLEDAPALPAGDIAQTNFNFVNNQSSAADITGFLFSSSSVRSFVAEVSIERGTTAEAYIIQGINIDGSFSISQEAIGDDVGVTLSIASSGQMQYISSDSVDGGVIRFRARSLTF